VDSTSRVFCFQIENCWRASRRRLAILEVPITFVDRPEGQSKMSPAIAVDAIWRAPAPRLQELRRTRSSRAVHPHASGNGSVDVSA
jgi:dolichol-phosphate mannosyltransferase